MHRPSRRQGVRVMYQGPSMPTRVVVIGGGTAGWMTAASLASLLPHRADVVLVESEEIGIVGVGEATLPSLRAFNERIGIDEARFMKATCATFKYGIDFRDWGRVGDGYINPFGQHGVDWGDVPFHHFWARTRGDAGALPMEAYSLPAVAGRMGRFAHTGNAALGLAPFGYAYQFDATLFAPFLRSLAEQRGARRVEGRVVEVLRDGVSGHVTAVRLAGGRVVEGDLFVDCSGFRSLLLGDALGEPWEDWSRWLPCDSAVAVPCRSVGPLLPLTTATAMSAGWRWRIPLQHRVGNGYVYASDHVGDDAAREALLSAIEGEPLAEPRLLRFRPGRRRRGWVGNVVGAGLAGGFLEPLESTSIYLVQIAIHMLIELFPGRNGITPAATEQFNRQLDLEYERIRDFLILHYHATERDDSPFWHRVRTMSVPDTLTEKMELFRRRGRVAQYGQGLFLEPSWVSVYAGQRVQQQEVDQRAVAMPSAQLRRMLAGLATTTRAAAAAMPDHAAVLARYGLSRA